MKLNTFPDRIIEIDHQDYLYFGGTAYFLPTNTEFKNILVKAFYAGQLIWQLRNANIKLTAYENSEHFLAKFIKAGRWYHLECWPEK
jgi:hypothetical protein